jgi:endonuclease YncB( thermonuclease family)
VSCPLPGAPPADDSGMWRILAVLSSLAMLLLASAASAADLVGQASIIDGDTIEIHGQSIRLFGIDAGA